MASGYRDKYSVARQMQVDQSDENAGEVPAQNWNLYCREGAVGADEGPAEVLASKSSPYRHGRHAISPSRPAVPSLSLLVEPFSSPSRPAVPYLSLPVEPFPSRSRPVRPSSSSSRPSALSRKHAWGGGRK